MKIPVHARPYKRILIKISGEMLLGEQPFGINQGACLQLAKALQRLHEKGLEMAIVIGGGNIFRGINLRNSGLQRTAADHMGMLATLMNGIALKEALSSCGLKARVMSALECPKVVETYNWDKAMKYISDKEILIFVGGTGNPYFTTDTAAALRASEINADLFAKATKVDGIYNKDPFLHPDAVKYPSLSYSQALKEQLKIMDATAFALCESNQLPIYVFNMQRLLNSLSPDDHFLDPKQGTFVTND